MAAKLHPAFGYALVRTELQAGEIVYDGHCTNGVLKVDGVEAGNIQRVGGALFIWMIANGKHTHTNVQTGEKFTLEGGWCSLNNPLPSGIYSLTIDEDSHSVCLASDVNTDRPFPPDVEYFSLRAGEARQFPQGTKLYLVEGGLQIDGAVFSNMRQLRFSSGDKIVTANKNSFGLIFNV
jgi:hypothetical protein